MLQNKDIKSEMQTAEQKRHGESQELLKKKKKNIFVNAEDYKWQDSKVQQ